MANYRKFVLIFLLALFAGLSAYFVSSAIKNPDASAIIISIIFLFLFTIFNSVLFAASAFYTSLITHIIIAAFLFLVFYNIGLNIIATSIVAVIYLMFQMYGYFRVFYFEKDRLTIKWTNIFRSAWFSISWFLIFALALFFIIKLDVKTIDKGIFSNIIKKMEPLLNQFHLPNLNSKIEDLAKKQILEKELQQLQNVKIPGFIVPTDNQLTQETIEEFNKQFNLKLKGNETIADTIALYLENVWIRLNDSMKLIVKIVLVTLIVTTFQPILWILGGVLSVAALPIFALLEKLHFYRKETQQVEKEKIVI